MVGRRRAENENPEAGILAGQDLNAASIRRNTDQRFIENNISALVIEKLTEPVKRRLAQITTDEGFVAAVELAHRASMSSTEAFAFVTEVNELRSSAKQVAFIKDRAADLSDRIGSTGGGVLNRKRQGPRTLLRLAAGRPLGHPSHRRAHNLTSTWCPNLKVVFGLGADRQLR